MTPPRWRAIAVPDGLDVVHEDDALLVLNKPSGLLSVPGRGPENADCLSARAQARYPDALIVHRLDMGTSGLMVMARGLVAQRTLSASFARREVHKRYVAVVAGDLTADGQDAATWRTIDWPLIIDWPNRPRSKVDVNMGKPSRTHWRPIAAAQDHVNWPLPTTRVELEPVTGRSHQLRVHLQALGHPILGDELYAPPTVVEASPRLLLHAQSLSLPHPLTGKTIEFEAPPAF